ncbi:hypothetical protein OROGR_020677 [Orobanche gracilis]
MNGDKIKCPCTASKCKNQRFLDTESVKEHLVRNGFVPNYEVWIFHGETNLTPDEGGPSASRQEEASQNPSYVVRDSSKGVGSKDKPSYLLVHKHDDQQLADKSATLANDAPERENGGPGSTGFVKKILLNGKEKETSNHN